MIIRDSNGRTCRNLAARWQSTGHSPWSLAHVILALGLAVVLALLVGAPALAATDRSTVATAPAVQVVTSPVTDHGGAVLAHVTVHTIWWGPAAAFPADEREAVTAALPALASSAYLATIDEYLRGASATVSVVASNSWTDPSTPPTTLVTADVIAEEVARYLAATGRHADPTAVYVVLTSSAVTGPSCAWHSARVLTTAATATLVPIVYLPTTTGVARCAAGAAHEGVSDTTASVLTSLAHELVETMTDPIPGATWTDAQGAEISDRCADDSTLVDLGRGQRIPVQGVWSDTAGRCTVGG